MSYFPIQIGTDVPTSQPQSNSAFPPGGQTIFSFAGKLFAIQLWTDLVTTQNAYAQMYKSDDGGQNWVHQDSTHDPLILDSLLVNPSNVWWPVQNGSKITIVAVAGATAPYTPFFQSFNLITLLWEPIFGAIGAPFVIGIDGIWIQSNGKIELLCSTSTPDQVVFFYDGIWTGPFVYAAGVGNGVICANLDATDILHVFSIGLHYYRIRADGSLAMTTDLTALDISDQTGQAVIVSNSLVKPVLRPITAGTVNDFQSVLVGTPLSAPIFSLLNMPGVVPLSYNVNQPYGGGYAITDGINAYVSLIEDTGSNGDWNKLVVSQSLDLSTWIPSTLFDYKSDPVSPNFLMPNSLAPSSGTWGSLLFTILALTNSPGNPNALFFLVSSAGSFSSKIIIDQSKARVLQMPFCFRKECIWQ